LTAEFVSAQLEISVVPPRFEITGNPGDKVRQVIEITNQANKEVTFDMRTADWEFDANFGVIVRADSLTAGSCRPWVALEQRQIKLKPGQKKKFRFEITVPSGTPDGECRFAVLITPSKEQKKTEAQPPGQGRRIKLELTAQFAAVVYLGIGKAEAKLEVQGFTVKKVGSKKVPAVKLRNSGNAHGRPAGELTGKDASGNPVTFTVAGFPVLAGKTAVVALEPSSQTKSYKFPLTLKGDILWEGGSAKAEGTIQ
jgi:hypothetical protein